MAESSSNEVLKKTAAYQVRGAVWIECDLERFLGKGRVELLQKIEETGSISKAARQMEMSYKKAQGMVNALNTYSAIPIVITQTGGEKGGGSSITAAAKKLIDHYLQMQQRFQDFLQQEASHLSSL